MRANWKRSTELSNDSSGEFTEKRDSRQQFPLTDPNALPPLRLPLLLGIIFIITLADQVTKWIVIHRLLLYESAPIVSGVLSITRVHNSGIAFGLFPGLPDVFMVITLVSMAIVLYFYVTVEPRTLPLAIACGLILGGATGNLIDRFRFGYVVDFIDFSFWPAFNIADSSVSVGVALLLLNFFLEKKG